MFNISEFFMLKTIPFLTTALFEKILLTAHFKKLLLKCIS